MSRFSQTMKETSQLLCLLVVFSAGQSHAVKVTSNGLQRVNRGANGTFQWTIHDEPIASYKIFNRTTGSPTALHGYSYHEYDSAAGVVTLVLLDVQPWDSGNYSLQITATDTTTITESTACLFVYGILDGSVTLTSGSNEAIEGDAVELTCNLTSTSLPASLRPEIHYAWANSKYWRFRNISSGPAVLPGGDPVPGYAIKNNGRTIRISSVRYPDDRYVTCMGLEDGSNRAWDDSYYHFSLRYRPYAERLNPASRKFNVAIGKQVYMSFDYTANPAVSSVTNWTFVNSSGIPEDLPTNAYTDDYFSYSSYRYLRFNFTSSAYYGNYSVMMTNSIGSTIVTFQVVPEDRPDRPTNVRLLYSSHSSIAVQCNRMWSNSLSPKQTIFFRLKVGGDGKIGATVGLSSISYTYEDYNTTITAYFTKDIHPQTNYTLNVWSVNNLGSSDVVELKVRTPGQPKINVSPETISLDGSQAIIKFTVESIDVDGTVKVEAHCCSLFTGQCSSYSGRYSENQVIVDDIPNGTVYYIDLNVYSGIDNRYSYLSNSVRVILDSRNRNEGNVNECLSHPKAVVVLAILLGIACLFLFVVCVVFAVRRFASNRQSATPTMEMQ